MLGGTGNGIQWVSVMTALQEATPSDYQARVVGLLESSLAAMPGVGYLIGGILTAAWSPRTAYAVAGIGTLVLVLIALVVLARPAAAPPVAARGGSSAARRRRPTCTRRRTRATCRCDTSER